jgi:hypothetical protein
MCGIRLCNEFYALSTLSTNGSTTSWVAINLTNMNETEKELSLCTNANLKRHVPLSESIQRTITEDSASVDKAVSDLRFRLLGIAALKAGQKLGRLTPKGSVAFETISPLGMSKGSAAMTGPRLTNKQVEENRAQEEFACILRELTPNGASSCAAKGKGAKSSPSGASSGAAKGKIKGKSKNVQTKAMPKPSASSWRTPKAKVKAIAAAVAVAMPTIADSVTIRFDVPLYELQDLSSW